VNVLDVVDDPDNNEPLENEGPAVPPLREEAEVDDNDDDDDDDDTDDNEALVDSVVPHSDIRLCGGGLGGYERAIELLTADLASAGPMPPPSQEPKPASQPTPQ
jgi:hypothetical protein